MIVVPRPGTGEWGTIASFMRYHAKVSPSPDMVFFGWVSDAQHRRGSLVMGVSLDGFLGKTAQINVAMAEGFHFVPKAMLREVFYYAFVTAQREVLLGVLNSKNTKAMRFDAHLGFREVARLPGVHENGGDFVLLAMTRGECRYLDLSEVPHGQEIRSAAAA